MKWIKASERLPDGNDTINGLELIIFRHTKSQSRVMAVCLDITPNIPALLKNELDKWEWLDESTPTTPSAMEEALREAIKEAENNYNSAKASADWFNNNTPGVGQTIDYQSYEPLPSWVIKAKASLSAPVSEDAFTCKHCGEHEKYWSKKNDDWYCKTCGHLCE